MGLGANLMDGLLASGLITGFEKRWAMRFCWRCSMEYAFGQHCILGSFLQRLMELEFLNPFSLT
jgi:hypothetical protein